MATYRLPATLAPDDVAFGGRWDEGPVATAAAGRPSSSTSPLATSTSPRRLGDGHRLGERCQAAHRDRRRDPGLHTLVATSAPESAVLRLSFSRACPPTTSPSVSRACSEPVERAERPDARHDLAHDERARDHAPVPAVTGLGAVVAHHEVAVGRDDLGCNWMAERRVRGRYGSANGLPSMSTVCRPTRCGRRGGRSPVSRGQGPAPPRSLRPGVGRNTMSFRSMLWEVVAELADQDPVADLEGRLHRARGDVVRLDDEGAQQDGGKQGRRRPR